MMKNFVNGDKLISIWKIENEALGLLLMKVLEIEGIPCELRSEQIPWMDGIMKAARGYWGGLMVLDRDAVKAREIIKSYLEEKDTESES
ncbi:MAG: hypothetical protein P9M10_09875 [Candidatus Euphemobacter frigidus]|nr:hypothetical protein [Candidatus Euphemobacter frigidus]